MARMARDGYALMKMLRGETDEALAALPAVALTAYARAEDRAQALAAGFTAHLSKPVDPHELVAAVSRLSVN